MNRGLRWIQVSFVDVFGAVHSLEMPAGQWERAIEHGMVFDGSALEGEARLFESDMLLRPVTSSLVAFGQGAGRALGEVLTTDGEPWPGDPRTVLVDVIERTRDVGRDWQARCELEFYLLDSDGKPIDQGCYFDGVQGQGASVVRAAADMLELYGVDIESSHHEAGPGQYELGIGRLGPLETADAIVMAKEAVREAAAFRNLRATFMARPLESQAGSGLHVHQYADGWFVGDQLTPTGSAFLGGQLAHARGLCALTSPNVNSYKRLHCTDEAPGAVMWSHRHRSALIRVSEGGIEHRGADPGANAYLLVAGLLLAGADGIDTDAEAGPAQDESAGGFDPTAQSTVYRTLPLTLDDALDALVADDVFADGLGDSVLRRLVDGRRIETASYRQYITTWERDRYLDRA